jgi:two-component system, OmpR family, response regulator CpxR
MKIDSKETNLKVLIIDDDQKLCRLLKEYLDPMGYMVSVAHTGDDGLKMAIDGDYSAVILDVMLPGMDGFEVLKKLRAESDVPVLMLTSRGDETDRVVGLEMGADDYLPKTFSTRELLARLRAVTRRSSQSSRWQKDIYDKPMVVGPLCVDPASRKVELSGEALDLTPIEFDILGILIGAAGRVLSRDQLLDKVAGRDYEVFDRSIDVHISSLRRKLGDDPKKPRFIKTVRAVGYLFLDEDSKR